jgi:serine/threonine protein kinase
MNLLYPVKVTGVEPSENPGVTLEGTEIKETDRVFEDDYSIDRRLRSGSYGTVYTTRHKKTNEEFAVKVIDRAKLKEKDDTATFREIGIMKDLIDVKNIVRLVDVYITQNTFQIVQFYAKGGDVFDRLAKRVSYSEMDARVLSAILMKTMRDMHARKICHRDMKPENLLLKNLHDDSSILLADFGFAKYVPEEGLKTRCGTPAFVAPEIIVGKPYNTQADMWSVGCLIFMLIGGYPPFQDETHRGLFRKIRGSNFTFHASYWKNVSMQSKQLITNLLTVDPTDRLDASKSLSMPWFQERDEHLSNRDLYGSIKEIKKFNARRTFRSAVAAVAVATAFQVEKISDLMKETDKHVEEDQEKVEEETDGSTASPPVMHKLNMSLTKKKKFAELYQVRDKIHHGSEGVVKRCYSKVHHKEFAVKIIERDHETDEQVLHEVSIMNQLHHENLVAVVDFFEEDDFYYIVMELMAGGDVFDRIIDLNNYTEKDARDLAKILLVAVDYMHKSGVVHRDIKPQNIFLESKDDNSAIKVGDFGFAKRVHTPKSLNQRCGTPSYVAPEILKNQPYDQSCDMWSVGVVLYVTLCGYTPFMEEQHEEMFRRVKLGDWNFDPEDWSQISDEAKDLIKGLICTNPDRRLTASQALSSKWITGVSDKYLSERSLTSTMRLVKDKNFRLKDVAMAIRTLKIKAKAELKNTLDTSLKVTEKLTVSVALAVLSPKIYMKDVDYEIV